MTLAQVVYRISTDSDFATRMQIDPENTLKENDFHLSKEEHAFLANSLRRSFLNEGSLITKPGFGDLGGGWK